LDADRFAGGDMTLDRAAAEAAVARVAQDLSIDTVAAAQGIFTVVNTAMAEGIRLVSVKRGFDPRRFALLSFGGAAGLHITEIARRLEIRRVVVPRVAALLSAWGMLNTDLRYEVVRSRIGDMRQIPAAELRAILNGIEADGRARLGDMFAGKIRAEASLDLRYGEQVHTINVSLAGLDLDDPDFMANTAERFHARHKSLYTFNQPTEPVVLINARVAVVGELDALPPEEVLVTAQPTGAAGARRVYLDGWRMIPVFNLDELAGSQTVEGPAIIEAPTTTVLLRKSEHASLTPQRWLDIRLPSQQV
jgi:N-methylhydantoinase A